MTAKALPSVTTLMVGSNERTPQSNRTTGTLARPSLSSHPAASPSLRSPTKKHNSGLFLRLCFCPPSMLRQSFYAHAPSPKARVFVICASRIRSANCGLAFRPAQTPPLVALSYYRGPKCKSIVTLVKAAIVATQPHTTPRIAFSPSSVISTSTSIPTTGL